MSFDLSAASNILKVRYIGTLRDQLNNSSYLWNQLEKKTQMVSGKSFTIALQYDRTAAAAISLAEGATLPTADAQAYANAIVPNSYQYGRIQVSGPAIAAARDNVGAFVQGIESEVDGLQRDTKRAMNRMVHSDGVDALGYCVTADNATPIDIDDNRGNAFVHFPTKAISCDVLDASSSYAVLNTGALVSTLGAKSATSYSLGFTGGSLAGTADGDAIVLRGTGGYAMMGIAGIVDDADPPLLTGGLHGLPVSSNAWWKAQVFDNSGTNRAFAFEDLQEVIDAVATNSAFTEQDIDLLLCSYGVRRTYFKACIADRQHVNTMELDGGWKALNYNGMPLVADSQCRRNRIYVLCMKSMAILRTSDFDWLDKDGSYLSRVANVDAYEATLFHYGNLACFARNANGLYDDITEN